MSPTIRQLQIKCPCPPLSPSLQRNDYSFDDKRPPLLLLSLITQTPTSDADEK